MLVREVVGQGQGRDEYPNTEGLAKLADSEKETGNCCDLATHENRVSELTRISKLDT
jgi:hypothetical protein